MSLNGTLPPMKMVPTRNMRRTPAQLTARRLCNTRGRAVLPRSTGMPLKSYLSELLRAFALERLGLGGRLMGMLPSTK